MGSLRNGQVLCFLAVVVVALATFGSARRLHNDAKPIGKKDSTSNASEKRSSVDSSNNKQEDDLEWTRHAVLDSNRESLVDLFWNVDREAGLLTFEVRARMLGWVGVGFSPSGGMAGADIVTCWVKDGVPHFQDRHAVEEGLPSLDASQDYTLLMAYENETHTVCRFSRNIDTCDLDEDRLITSDTTRIIYAFGMTDPEDEDPYYHGENRGTTSIYLLDPPTGVVPPDPDTTKIYEMRTPNATIYGNKDTTYICSLHKGINTDTKHQYIGYVPVMSPPENVKYVHHALVYECFVETPEEVAAMEADVGKSAECYGSHMPELWGRCITTHIAWAVGSEGQMYPENVGFPLKRVEDGPYFYMMEMHYNNPMFDTFEDNSGLLWYYTDVVREFDMGVLQVGLAVTPFQVIPPNQASFTTVSVCPVTCTENGLPEDGVNVFAGELHAHLLGRKMKLRLVRNGVEEPWLEYDDNYDFDFQETRVFPEMRKLLPGDILILECTMDSTKMSGATTGGWGTDDEMCLSFLSYYPKSTISRCQTYIEFELAQEIFGFPDLIQDTDNFQFLVDENTTFPEFLNSKFGPWEDEAFLQTLRDLASTKITNLGYCLNENMELISDIVPSTYPEMVEYQPPPRNCSSSSSSSLSKEAFLRSLHPGFEPVEMTKSLQIAFPKLARSGGHIYKKIKKA